MLDHHFLDACPPYFDQISFSAVTRREVCADLSEYNNNSSDSMELRRIRDVNDYYVNPEDRRLLNNTHFLRWQADPENFKYFNTVALDLE